MLSRNFRTETCRSTGRRSCFCGRCPRVLGPFWRHVEARARSRLVALIPGGTRERRVAILSCASLSDLFGLKVRLVWECRSNRMPKSRMWTWRSWKGFPLEPLRRDYRSSNSCTPKVADMGISPALKACPLQRLSRQTCTPRILPTYSKPPGTLPSVREYEVDFWAICGCSVLPGSSLVSRLSLVVTA